MGADINAKLGASFEGVGKRGCKVVDWCVKHCVNFHNTMNKLNW
jgi:hypothetical protein